MNRLSLDSPSTLEGLDSPSKPSKPLSLHFTCDHNVKRLRTFNQLRFASTPSIHSLLRLVGG
jgi:hypothetical protein